MRGRGEGKGDGDGDSDSDGEMDFPERAKVTGPRGSQGLMRFHETKWPGFFRMISIVRDSKD